MYDLLFSTPWWLPTLILALGIALFIAANNRQATALRNVALAVLAIGIILPIVSYLVETNKEKVDRHTHELVAEIVSSNWPVVQSLLDPQISFAHLHGPSQIVQALQAAQQNVHVTSAHIAQTRIDASPDVISENIEVYTVQELTLDRPILTGWRLDWAPTADNKDWKLIKVEPLGSSQIRAEDVTSHIPGA
jgi:hypothetical protein